jgi:hypothetical protein
MFHRITTLGEPRYPSPLSRFVSDDWFVPEHVQQGANRKVRFFGPFDFSDPGRNWPVGV